MNFSFTSASPDRHLIATAVGVGVEVGVEVKVVDVDVVEDVVVIDVDVLPAQSVPAVHSFTLTSTELISEHAKRTIRAATGVSVRTSSYVRKSVRAANSQPSGVVNVAPSVLTLMLQALQVRLCTLF